MKLLKRILVSLSLTFFAFSFANASNAAIGTVVKVIDGDTVWVTNSTGKKSFKLRFQYVDAPEICQDYGQESKAFVENLLLNKKVNYKLTGGKTYDRFTGNVTVDGKNISEELLKSGNAWLQTTGVKKDSPLRNLVADAKSQRLGLWVSPNPVDPLQFRKTKKCGYKKK